MIKNGNSLWFKKEKEKKGVFWNFVKDIFIIFDMNMFIFNNKKIGKYWFVYLNFNVFVLCKIVVIIFCFMYVI